MATKIIVSYDGSDNDRDALALGRLLATAGATIELAYVRHALRRRPAGSASRENEAAARLKSGAAALGQPDLPTHVVLSASTSEGLRELAVRERADMIVFGSEYRTAIGRHRSAGVGATPDGRASPVALALKPPEASPSAATSPFRRSPRSATMAIRRAQEDGRRSWARLRRHRCAARRQLMPIFLIVGSRAAAA